MAIATLAFGVGWLIGFMFGIPKVVSERRERFRGNTNLERISDWLPQIFIGIGIAELNQVLEGVWKVSERVQSTSSLDPVASSAVIGSCLIAGFVRGYLVTRLFLHQSMAQADDKVLGQGTSTVTTAGSEGPKVSLPLPPPPPPPDKSADEDLLNDESDEES